MTLKNPASAELLDVLGQNDVTFDVNFDEEHKDCIKISMGGEKPLSAVIKYTDIFSMMFTLATKEQQAKMMPVREEKGTQYMKTITIKTTKDLKEGELITVNVPINVPDIIEQSIREQLSTQELTPSEGTVE